MTENTASLMAELGKAEALARQAGFDDWVQFLSQHNERLRRGDHSGLRPLWVAFAPTCDWDDLAIRQMPPAISEQLVGIGQSVFEAVERVEVELGLRAEVSR